MTSAQKYYNTKVREAQEFVKQEVAAGRMKKGEAIEYVITEAIEQMKLSLMTKKEWTQHETDEYAYTGKTIN